MRVLFEQLNGIHDALHDLGLCNLDLHRGNIIMRRSDGRPIFIDLDEQRLYPRNNSRFKLRCRIGRKKLNEEFNLMLERNKRNLSKSHQKTRIKDSAGYLITLK